jgi:hypothetical protein
VEKLKGGAMKPESKKILLVFIGLAAIVAIPLIWITVDDFNYASLSPMAKAKRSPLIVYAKCDTNGTSFVAQEIWKDTRKSHSPVIGLKLLKWNEPDAQIPDGAVFFYEKVFWFDRHLEPRTFVCVYSGRIEGMTLDEYKKTCNINVSLSQ